jgi:hypothetical protein
VAAADGGVFVRAVVIQDNEQVLAEIGGWLKDNPRIILHFTPTGAGWCVTLRTCGSGCTGPRQSYDGEIATRR